MHCIGISQSLFMKKYQLINSTALKIFYKQLQNNLQYNWLLDPMRSLNPLRLQELLRLPKCQDLIKLRFFEAFRQKSTLHLLLLLQDYIHYLKRTKFINFWHLNHLLLLKHNKSFNQFYNYWPYRLSFRLNKHLKLDLMNEEDKFQSFSVFLLPHKEPLQQHLL